jgi:hypothetical protein
MHFIGVRQIEARVPRSNTPIAAGPAVLRLTRDDLVSARSRCAKRLLSASYCAPYGAL